jgi:hypothetical protein
MPNENNPYALFFIDNPSAGTYSYSLKANSVTADTDFGEADGPVLSLIELQNVVGATGAAGTSGTSGTSGSNGATGAAGTSGTSGTSGFNGATGATGPAGPIGSTGAGGALGYYASFIDTTDQTLPAGGTAQRVTINTPQAGLGITLDPLNPGRIIIANPATYSMIFSIELANADQSNEHYADIWLKYNGSDYPNSNTRFFLPKAKNSSTPSHVVATVNFIGTSFAPNDYVELWWTADDTDVSIETIPAGTSPVTPLTPSVICTLSQVMYTQVGPTGATGATGASGSTGATGAAGATGATGSFVSPYTGNIQINGQAWISADANGNTTSTTAVNWDDSNIQTFTLDANPTTFTFANPNAGATYILIIRQNSAGSYTVNWPSGATGATWSGGSTPTMTPTANRYDVYTFIYDGSKYFGSYVQNFT